MTINILIIIASACIIGLIYIRITTYMEKNKTRMGTIESLRKVIENQRDRIYYLENKSSRLRLGQKVSWETHKKGCEIIKSGKGIVSNDTPHFNYSTYEVITKGKKINIQTEYLKKCK